MRPRGALSLTLRPYRPRDAGSLAALHARAFDPPQLGLSYWRGARNEPPNLCVVAERDGRLVGYCDGFLAGEGGDVASVASAPDARGQGIGRAVLSAFLREAAKRRASVIHLEVSEVNAPALALYAGLGFERVGTRRAYYADGSDAAVMARPLGSPAPGV